MRLECRFPLSPTPSFINRARLIAASVRDIYPGAVIRASVYPPVDGMPDGIAHWSPSAEAFESWAGTRAPFTATVLHSYRPPFAGDFLVFLDADVLPVARFDELFEHDAIQGVQTHIPPMPPDQWRALFLAYGLPEPAAWIEHSGAGVMCAPGTASPFYPNSGMVAGPRTLFERLSPAYGQAVRFLRGVMGDVYWIDQVGLALGLAAAGVAVHPLPLRWNFPNRASFDAAHPAELADARFVHAMDTSIADRDRDFASREAMEALVARMDLVGSNEVLRDRVQRLLARGAAA